MSLRAGLFEHWTTAELKAMARRFEQGRSKVDRDRYDEPREEAAERKREANTLFLVAPLTSQIMGYQRRLQSLWRDGLDEMTDLAADAAHNRVFGYQEADERAKKRIADMTGGFLETAVEKLRKAFNTGNAFATSFTERDRLSSDEKDGLVGEQLKRNAAFVTGSLMADAQAKFSGLVRDASLSPEATSEAMDKWGDSQLARVGMYALKVWGVAHLAFGTQMLRSGRLLYWVVTSDDPCEDCPRLEAGSPYGPLKPLPTFPGTGDTECRTNCLCMLREAKAGKVVAFPASLPGMDALVTHLADLVTATRETDAHNRQHMIEAIRAVIRGVQEQPITMQFSPTFEPRIEIPAPVVNVEAPHVEVMAAEAAKAPEVKIDVHVPRAPAPTERVTKRILRDAKTLLIDTVEETVEVDGVKSRRRSRVIRDPDSQMVTAIEEHAGPAGE